MIIVKVLGGLGNQMFQYAAGRALALTNGCELKLDIMGFDNYRLHNGFELGSFNINAASASQCEIKTLIGATNNLVRIICRKLGATTPLHYFETSFFFDAKFFKLTPPIYLEGYWQSPKYFEAFASQIRRELAPKTSLTEKNIDLVGRMGRTNSVSVHVRRGDYVSNRAVNKVHGFVGMEYYHTAFRRVLETVVSPTFFVFSDDMLWVRENLVFPGDVIYVDHNIGKSSFEDMCLMSACCSHVVANSSFSWWGAWLDPNPDKLVIVPERWFVDASFDTRDLFPKEWVVL